MALFLCKDDDREIAKIIDAGIVKRGPVGGAARQAYEDRYRVGDDSLLEPEQAQGSRVSTIAPTLGVGYDAFECLVGRKPFQGGTVGELLINLMISPLPVPSKIASDLPPSLDLWWERAASRDLSKRFSTVKEMVDALAQALGISTVDPLAIAEGTPSLVPVSSPTSSNSASDGRDNPTKTHAPTGGSAQSMATAGNAQSSGSFVDVSSATGARGKSSSPVKLGVAAVVGLVILAGVGLAARSAMSSSQSAARKPIETAVETPQPTQTPPSAQSAEPQAAMATAAPKEPAPTAAQAPSDAPAETSPAVTTTNPAHPSGGSGAAKQNPSGAAKTPAKGGGKGVNPDDYGGF
ncbi:MAG: hypothetical protein U0165_16005 [Polyangiaceae bacterium]